MKLLTELRRRNVDRMAVMYAVVAWLIMQLTEVTMSLLELPTVTGKLVLVLLAIGFPIALIVSWFYVLTPEGLSLEKDVTAQESIAHVTGRRVDFIIISLLCAAVLVFAYDKWRASMPPEQSIAVLPFVDLSPDGDQEYFADGLAEEFITRLSQLDGLLVSGRASSFYFKERDDDLKSIGQRLSVSHVLEGSVRKGGDELRVTARLTDASSGFQLWSETYEGGVTDVFAIQEQIAEAVATALSIRLRVGALGALEGGTNNVEAYDTYLAGNAAYQQDEILHAIRHYEQATELDPEFALAWAQMADACQQAFWDFGDSEVDRWLQRRDNAVSAAVDAAPESGQVLTFLAQIEIRRGNLQEARRLFDDIHGRDDESAPQYSIAYVDLLAKTGNVQEALLVARSIQRRDPMHPMLPNHFAHVYLSLGRLEEALDAIERGYADVNPKRYLSIEGLVVALAINEPDEIRKWVERWRRWYPPANRREFLPANLERLFDDSHSPEWLRAAFEASPAYDYHVINWAGYFGEDELALEAMARSLDLWAFWTPLTAEARTTEEFKVIVRDAGLVDYWREYGWNDFCAPIGVDGFECR